MRVTSRTGSARKFLGFWKSQLVEFCLGRRRLAFACSPKPGLWPCGECRTRWGADGKVIIERWCISLPYVETFNLKVIKGFVPELRSRYLFFVFRDSYVLCIYVTNILCTFHISVSWLWYRYFKWQTKEISHEKSGTLPRKGHLKRETDSFLMISNRISNVNIVEAI